MAEPPKFAFLFDSSALALGKTSEWQEFSTLGSCYLPDAVWDEVQFLCDRASDPQLEAIAREFYRFFPTSDWQTTAATSNHPALRQAPGSDLSKQARLTLAVARCAAAFSQEHPSQLVVVVANNQPLVTLLRPVTLPNLCAVTLANFKQWLRSPHSPPLSVHQQMMDMRMLNRAQHAGMASVAPAHPASAPKAVSRPTSMARPSHPPLSRSQPMPRRAIPPIVSSLCTLIGLVIAGLVGWRVAHPSSFNQLWQRLNLPTITMPFHHN